MNQIMGDGKISFGIKDVMYSCEFIKQENFDSSLPTLLIPTRDNLDLILYTIKNLIETKVSQNSNIIIIDDRSEENIRKSTIDNKLSYLRVDNEKGFNFSMLNNIPAKLCYDLGVNNIILWNSDLWCLNESSYIEVLKRHRESGSKISGTKLVYPPIDRSLNKTVDSKNIVSTFPSLSGGRWRETVQFGGDYWLKDREHFIPIHYKRFSEVDNPMVNCDRGCLFVTGAFQVWDLEHFINLGGLNPSLSKNYQDVDICIRSAESGTFPMYFGKDLFFYHDESLTMHNSKEQKNNNQMSSDHHLFHKLWQGKLDRLVM